MFRKLYKYELESPYQRRPFWHRHYSNCCGDIEHIEHRTLAQGGWDIHRRTVTRGYYSIYPGTSEMYHSLLKKTLFTIQDNAKNTPPHGRRFFLNLDHSSHVVEMTTSSAHLKALLKVELPQAAHHVLPSSGHAHLLGREFDR